MNKEPLHSNERWETDSYWESVEEKQKAFKKTDYIVCRFNKFTKLEDLGRIEAISGLLLPKTENRYQAEIYLNAARDAHKICFQKKEDYFAEMCQCIVKGSDKWIPVLWDFFVAANVIYHPAYDSVFREIMKSQICCKSVVSTCRCVILHFIDYYWFVKPKPLESPITNALVRSPLFKYWVLMNSYFDPSNSKIYRKIVDELKIVPNFIVGDCFVHKKPEYNEWRKHLENNMPKFGLNISYLKSLGTFETKIGEKYWLSRIARTVDHDSNLSNPFSVLRGHDRLPDHWFPMFQDLTSIEVKDPFILWEQEKRKHAVTVLLLMARKNETECVFHHSFLPLDMFKLIFVFSELHFNFRNLENKKNE